MPLYAYRCPDCGPFDHRRPLEEAGGPLACPQCSRPARRVYTAPGVRTRRGPLAGADAAERARIDRAITGEPVITGRPQGRPLPARHRH